MSEVVAMNQALRPCVDCDLYFDPRRPHRCTSQTVLALRAASAKVLADASSENLALLRAACRAFNE